MLEHILKDDPVYRQLKDEIEDYCGPVLVSGCTDTAKWHLTSLIGNHKKKQFKIIIVPDENKARQWVEASHFFGEKVQYIPAKDPLFYTADVHGNAIARDRMLAIKKIVDDKCGTFVMTIDAVMDQVVPLSDIKNHKMTFKMGETLEEATIAEEFVARGYEKAPFVEAPGEFAVRGGIIDIFPYTQESPYRIELWGDEIDSIRSFDKESQRSIEEVDTLTIYPASEIILNQPRIEHGLRNMEEDYEKLSQKFKKEKKSIKTKNAKTVSKKITKLKAAKKYYVRIRTYKGKKYSKWSKVKSIKTPKDTKSNKDNIQKEEHCTNNNNHSVSCGKRTGSFKYR